MDPPLPTVDRLVPGSPARSIEVALAPAPHEEAILTTEQVCQWLQISESQFYRLQFPAIRLGKRTTRYHAGAVLAELKRRMV